MEIASLVLGIVGVVLTLYFGASAVKSVRNKQKQNVKKGALGIQAGRDVKIQK